MSRERLYLAEVERLGADRHGRQTWISGRLLFRAHSREDARRRLGEEAEDWRLVRLKRANARERALAEKRGI